MLRHALNNFKKETGITKFKEKWSENKKLKIGVISVLVLLSVSLLILSQKAKVLSLNYIAVVTTETAARNFASICRIKPEMQMCLDFVELSSINSKISAYFFLWRIVFFVYWWLWVWKAFDGLIGKLKRKLSS